jgi:hypothetical protein
MFRYSLYAALLLAGIAPSALAQVQPEVFSYPVGLNPDGDNFLALHSVPNASDGTRIAKLGPDTLFTELGRSGGWVHVRLLSGDTGWVSANYVGCCRAAVGQGQDPAQVVATQGSSCDQLWYRRNAIFKEAGYCFRSPKAISAFGNAGCQYDSEADVPLSARQHEGVAQIQQEETYRGCPR